jgi:hypothetical protein
MTQPTEADLRAAFSEAGLVYHKNYLNDQFTNAFCLALARRIAAEREAVPVDGRRPHCETCGKDVPEVLCPTCAKWWHDNPPDYVVEIAKLREALGKAIDFLKTAPLESGYCCCGSAVKDHGMGDGHSPVDDLAYWAAGLQEQLEQALETDNG